MAWKLSEVNAMTAEVFTANFGDVAEHAPWVASQAASARPYRNRDQMVSAFASAVTQSSQSDKLELLRAHPDLAGKAAIAGTLTPDSKREQQAAGLDSLTPAEFARLSELNVAYISRFGFPFILAVKGASKKQVLAAIAARVERSREEEFSAAVSEVCRILRFRIEDRVEA